MIVDELEDFMLDYHTGLALGYAMVLSNDGAGPAYRSTDPSKRFHPSLNLNHCEPAMEHMAVILRSTGIIPSQPEWSAQAIGRDRFVRGRSIGEAVCRALVEKVYGHKIESPNEADGFDEDLSDLFG